MDSYVKETAQDELLYEHIAREVNRTSVFSAENNITVTKVDRDYAEGELTITASSLNPHGMVHGGCLATLADTVAGSAVVSRSRNCVTLNYAMSFLAPASGTTIKCVASPVKVGKTICVFSCLLTNDQGEKVATGEFTFFVVEQERYRR